MKTHNTTVPAAHNTTVLVLRVDVDRVDLEQPPDDVDVAVERGVMEGGPGAQDGRIHTKTHGMHAQNATITHLAFCMSHVACRMP